MIAAKKFDPETTAKILEAINVGATYEIACDYANVSYRSFRRWMVRGLKEKESEFGLFRQAVKNAKGKAAVTWLQVLQNAMVKDWTPAAWKLERRYYSSYSANPFVREEMKSIQEDIKKLKKQRKGEEKIETTPSYKVGCIEL